MGNQTDTKSESTFALLRRDRPEWPKVILPKYAYIWVNMTKMGFTEMRRAG